MKHNRKRPVKQSAESSRERPITKLNFWGSCTSQCCPLLVELRRYTHVQKLNFCLELERISRPHLCWLPKYFLKIYKVFSKHVNQLWQCLCWRRQEFVWCLCTILHRNNEQKGLQTGAETPVFSFASLTTVDPIYLSAQILHRFLSLSYCWCTLCTIKKQALFCNTWCGKH